MDPDPDEPLHEIVNAVLTNADPSVAEAVREFIASTKDPAPPVQAVVTESAEPVYINERRDTTEAPPLTLASVIVESAPIVVVDTPTSEIAPRTLQAAIIAESKPDAKATVKTPALERPTVRAEAIVVAAAAGAAPAIEVEAAPSDDADDAPTAAIDPALEQTRPTEHALDAVAEERGVTPLRMPSESSAYVPVRERPSRKVLVAAASLAAACIAATVGTIVWARSAVAEARQPADEPAPAPVALPVEKVVLPVAPAVVPATCSLTVRSSVAEATVWVDGASRGVAPVTLPATCGQAVAVEVRHPRYQDFKQGLTVDGEVEVDARLERDKTELTVWSEPAGAEVTYNGSVIGKTPLTARINRYEQGTLYFRAPGRETDWRRIVPKEATKTVSITLKPAR